MFKKIKRIGREWCEFTYNSLFNPPQGNILMLHRIGEWDGDRLECIEELKVTTTRVQKIIDQLGSSYDFVSLDVVADYINGNIQPSRPFICFTFDDGYKDNLYVGLPFFEKNQIPFSVFLTADFINTNPSFNYPIILERIVRNNEQLIVNGKAYYCNSRTSKNEVFKQLKELILSLPYQNFEFHFRKMFRDYLRPEYEEDLMMNWDEVRELSKSKLCTIGSHTMTHCRLADLSNDQLKYELQESKRSIEEQIGKNVKYLSYPFGWKTDVSETVFTATQRAGYSMGLVSYGGPVRRYDKNIYQVKRQMLLEYE